MRRVLSPDMYARKQTYELRSIKEAQESDLYIRYVHTKRDLCIQTGTYSVTRCVYTKWEIQKEIHKRDLFKRPIHETNTNEKRPIHETATIRRLLTITVFFCKRAL